MLIEHSRNKREEAERMKDPVYAQVVHEIEERDRLGWLNIFPLTFVALVVIAGFGGLNWIDGGKKSGLEEWADRVNHQRAIKKVWGKEYVAQLKKKYGGGWDYGHEYEMRKLETRLGIKKHDDFEQF